ncbi:MAG: MlaD family protein [Actinomycetota bacterium]|nr:MlaD family protein [Actinomycetota bacterium]
MRSRRASLAASPTMVGAVTVLIVVVAVFLAYQANAGLPFVPTYRVSVEVPNAAALVPGNEVRVSGVRVGQVENVTPEINEDGSVSAKLDLKLETDQDPLPRDSTVIIRSRSALGLKYLEIDRGTSDEGFDQGATIPVTAATPEPVEFDQVLSTFDDPTREAIQVNLTEFGNALAGRGASLNATIGELRPLVERLEPVMRNLASPRTGLSRFVSALSAAAAEVAPVAEVQAQLFVSLDRTFRAFADVSRPFIQETISKTPETLDTATETLPVIRPFVRHTGLLFAELRPGFRDFAPVSKDVAAAVSVGVKALRLAPAFNAQLDPTAQSLLNLTGNAPAREGLRDLTSFNALLNPPLAFITPAQAVCNYGSLLFRNVASTVGFGDGIGTSQRFLVLAPPLGPNNSGSPSSAPANDGSADPANFAHYNPYPNTAAPGQEFECEAGNEPYAVGQSVIGNPPGNQGTNTDEQLVTQKKKSKKKSKKKKKKGKS